MSPPSTTITWPVMKRESSLARKSAASAMCSGRPGSGHGCFSRARRSHASSRRPMASGVLIMPGAIALTRIRCAASSADTARLRCATAAFAAE